MGVACGTHGKNTTKLLGNLERKYHSEDAIADEKIILKRGMGKQDISCIYMAQDTVQSRVSVNTSGNTSVLKVGHLLTLRLLISYIYGAPSKARNANVVYIWTYVWQR